MVRENIEKIESFAPLFRQKFDKLNNLIGLEERKKEFLLSIKGGKNKYKRYLGAPIRYAGGKSLAVGLIVENIPSSIKSIMSPFLGGGSVEVALAKELGLPVKAYDTFDILINFWQELLHNKEDLIKTLYQLAPSPEKYVEIKKELNAHWKKEKYLSPLSLATHYYFNHNLSYGPGFLGWMSKIYQDKKKYYKLLNKLENFHVPNLSVEVGNFIDTIPYHKYEFIYADPPYYLTGDSKMFRGIYPQRNFPIHHNNFDHNQLAKLLLAHRGGFLLSYNDCSAVRNLYSGCKIIEVAWQYTMGQGETRIGFNRIESGTLSHVKKSHELLIIKEAS
ncbi:MAG: DNA adenine methylase [Hydrotalea sp.]|nr:DNA adenine methylase [Hydrotalea sp.]